MNNTEINEKDAVQYYEAIYRWKQGHQIFHIVLVHMNTLINEAAETIIQDNPKKLVSILERLSILYDAATASMKYTVSFPVGKYNEVIRPSMMPPFLKPGFSGLQNSEHKTMIEGFTNLKANLITNFGDLTIWPEDIKLAWGKVLEAQKRNRKSHGHVCQEFVPDGVSLLKSFYQDKKNISK